jgi:hypothetical protein
MYRVKEITDVFVDACVRSESGELLLLSCYGRDTAVQQLLAAFDLGPAEGGLSAFTLVAVETLDEHRVEVGNAPALTKFSGRLPRENLFGALVHSWIYRSSVVRPDRSNGIAWLFDDQCADTAAVGSNPRLEDRLWELVEDLSPVPLLPHWRTAILNHVDGLILPMQGTPYPPLGRVRAFQVRLPDDFLDRITELIRNGMLLLELLAQAA